MDLGPISCTLNVDVAKDVFEFLADGPELESAWAAFHVEEASSSGAAPAEGGNESEPPTMGSDTEE